MYSNSCTCHLLKCPAGDYSPVTNSFIIQLRGLL